LASVELPSALLVKFCLKGGFARHRRSRASAVETLSGAYFDLRDRIDRIVAQAEQQGSLTVAITGLNSIRHTLDSLARIAGHDQAAFAR